MSIITLDLLSLYLGAPQPGRIDALLIHITDPGWKQWREYPIEEVHSIHFCEITEPLEKAQRGVFGYVSWGATETHSIAPGPVWHPAQYVNWMDSFFTVPAFFNGRPSHLRMWFRPKVRADYRIAWEVPGNATGVILTPQP